MDAAVRVAHCLVITLIGLSAVAGLPTAHAADPLPHMQLDPTGTTVSGLSSGAYMAVQVHVANSSSIIGAGVVAGGPYFCAEGQLHIALNRCMQTFLGQPDALALLTRARTIAAAGRIDPLENLAKDRVYLFSGTRDATVTQPVMDAARDFYRLAGIGEHAIKYVNDIPAGHAFIVEEARNPCGITESPFINDCDYDQAGDLLRHLYGTLAPPEEMREGNLLTFDQSEYLADPETHGMASMGFVYRPSACVEGERCRLHIAFAGCKQTVADIGDLFARTTGFNRWAESNRLVILYPQSSASAGNPNGCWDWWGYDDPTYHTKSGRQMTAIAKMAARLGVVFAESLPMPFCQRHDGWNWNHWIEGRVKVCGWFSLCGVGSGNRVGFYYSTSTLYESPEGVFSTTPCSP
jgi:poly(3-hydroxybutyrate) depolymerase